VTLSFGNIMLIASQKPDATNVAGLRTWNSLGRFVRRGEKGIFILAPMVGNKRNKDENAEQSTDAKETQRTLYGFRGVYVFERLSRDLRSSLCIDEARYVIE
jgi:N-terminal domain of anti-restriction factor ArdC